MYPHSYAVSQSHAALAISALLFMVILLMDLFRPKDNKKDDTDDL